VPHKSETPLDGGASRNTLARWFRYVLYHITLIWQTLTGLQPAVAEPITTQAMALLSEHLTRAAVHFGGEGRSVCP
jgi:hypothetical protein